MIIVYIRDSKKWKWITWVTTKGQKHILTIGDQMKIKINILVGNKIEGHQIDNLYRCLIKDINLLGHLDDFFCSSHLAPVGDHIIFFFTKYILVPWWAQKMLLSMEPTVLCKDLQKSLSSCAPSYKLSQAYNFVDIVLSSLK